MARALAGETGTAQAGRVTPIRWDTLLAEQLTDDFCVDVRGQINTGERLPFTDDHKGLLVITDCNPQSYLLPVLLREIPLRSASRAAFQSLGRPQFVLRLATVLLLVIHDNDAFKPVKKFVTCTRNRIMLRKHASKLRFSRPGLRSRNAQ